MLQTRRPATPFGMLVPQVFTRAEQVWPLLAHLEQVYPGFREWFWGKFAPGIDTGFRRAFTHSGAHGLDGVVLAKADPTERKLCTIWVAEGSRGRRIASELVAEACDWMGDHLPLLTVPEERLSELAPLARARGFQATQALRSYYREGRVEYVFNGMLRRHVHY